LSCGWDQGHTGTAHPEQQLSRLCAWVLQAEKQGLITACAWAVWKSSPATAKHTKGAVWKALALH